MFTGWIYDHLKPHAAPLKVAHPLMLRANRGSEKEERPHRCQQDLRLPAVRFSAGVLHGLRGDSRAAAHAALPQPAGAADGADEDQHQFHC
jgi:hypothetical protein